MTDALTVAGSTALATDRDSPPDLPGGAVRHRRLAWGTAGLLFAWYAVVSVQRHRLLLSSGWDLGIFEQVVRSYAQGHLPVSDLKGPDFPILGDHFSPVMALLAPLYRLFGRAETLLVAQAALLALAAVPLTGLAARRAGTAAGVVVGLGYGLSWGVAEAVGFDVHEVAFAVPLLAWSAVALAERRPGRAVLWALPLVLVKEDLGLTLAAVGLLAALAGRRRLGVTAAAIGVAATALEIGVIIPAFNPGGHNTYAHQVHGPWLQLAGDLLLPGTKLVTLALVAAPTAFVALRSPLVLLAVPTLLWRFAADNPVYWGTGYHYSVVLMPVVFAALADRLGSLRHPRRVLAAVAVVTCALIPGHPFAHVPDQLRAPYPAAVHALLDRIPSGVRVLASNSLAPHLTSRDRVYTFGGPSIDQVRPEYVVVDVSDQRSFPLSGPAQRQLLAQIQREGYTIVGSVGTTVLLHERQP